MFGTYLHGLFDIGDLTGKLAAWLTGRKGISVPDITPEPRAAYRNRQYDRLADAVQNSLDMKTIRQAMEAYAHENTARDFDYADTLRFTPDAVRQGVAAIRSGTPIVTDTNMAKAGVSRAGLRKFGGEVFCFMAEPFIAEQARAEASTRATAAMNHAAGVVPQAIFAVGNAPTALFALEEQLRKGLRPSLIIGAPVGFVNVVESKEG